jgi:hypothetical protein
VLYSDGILDLIMWRGFFNRETCCIGFFFYIAASENKKPGCTAIHEGSIRKICEIKDKDKVIWAVGEHGQKEGSLRT